MTNLPPPPSWTPPPSSGGGAGAPDVGAAISYGWKKFQQNVGPVLGVIAVYLIVQIALALIGIVIHALFLRILFQIVGMVVSAIVGIGIYQMALMITAGQPADVGKAFQYDRWGEWVVFSIVFGLMVGLGLALCIIPGLFVLAFFGLAPFYFIDAKMSLGEALSASRNAVSSKGLAFPILLSIVVGALGFIACFVGAFITVPVAYIAVAYLYRYATGQPVAA